MISPPERKEVETRRRSRRRSEGGRWKRRVKRRKTRGGVRFEMRGRVGGVRVRG